MKGSSLVICYHELGLEHLDHRYWKRRLCKKLFKTVSQYIHSLILYIRTSTRQPSSFFFFFFNAEPSISKTLFYWVSWENGTNLITTYVVLSLKTAFVKLTLYFIRPSEKKIYKTQDQIGTKLLTTLRLRFRHLHKHKFCLNSEHTFKLVVLLQHRGKNYFELFFDAASFLIKSRRILMPILMNIDSSLLPSQHTAIWKSYFWQ